MIGHYKAVVTADFIKQRDKKIAEDFRTDVNPCFQWDCEFVEWHQCQIDPNQIMYDGYEFDTIHTIYNNIDYKLYAKQGVKLSKYIQNQIINKTIDNIAVWKWTLPYKKGLYINQIIEYDILGIVPAQQALKMLRKNEYNEYRFPFEREEYAV